jgi:HAD superfamily hydrolase (TIGR01549 family)
MKINSPEKFQSLPSGILFDTDNTLYPYDPANLAAQEAVFDKAVNMLSIKKDKFEESYHAARKEIKTTLGATASSHSRLLYMQRALELLGLGSNPLLALDLEQTYWSYFLRNAQIFEGVPELLSEIRRFGIKAAIVTDLTAQIQFRKVVYFDLDHFFDFIVTSEEAGADKPSSLPFELAMHKLSCDPSNTWMIGDNPVNDIEGAKKALGAVTIQKKHKGVKVGEGPQLPDAVINNFSELRQLLSRLATK